MTRRGARALAVGALLFGARTAAAQSGGAPVDVRVSGTVTDSLLHAPLAGALVELVRADGIGAPARKATTDAQGRFTLPLSSGEWLAQLSHPAYDSLGVELPVRRITVPRSSVFTLALATPSARTIVHAFCPEAPTNSGVVVGQVRDAADGSAVRNADVRLEFGVVTIDRRGVQSSRQSVLARADANGWFVGCDVPGDGELAAWASAGAAATGLVAVAPSVRSVRRLDLDLDRAAVTARPAALFDSVVVQPTDSVRALPRTGTHRLILAVRDASGHPIPGVRAHVLGHPVANGDATGRVLLDSLPGGTQTLEIRAIGFVPYAAPVALSAERTELPPVQMLSVNALLDTIRVTTTSAYRAGMADFDRHRLSGLGSYLTAEDVARRRPMVATDLFTMIPGMLVSSRGFDKQVVILRAGHACTPAVFIDGALQRADAARELDFFVRPDEISGVEVYKGLAGIPPEFVAPGMDSCGAIVIWTRVPSKLPTRPVPQDR